MEGELISKPYIDITLNLLARFGIEVQRDPADPYAAFTLPQGSQYRSPGDIHVEADEIGRASCRERVFNWV